MNDHLNSGFKRRMAQIDEKLHFRNLFAPREETPVAEAARRPAKPELPSPEQLAMLAVLLSDKDAWFADLEAQAQKIDGELSPVDNALRRAMHVYLRAVRKLKHCETQDAVGLNRENLDFETFKELYDEFKKKEAESAAWRFYPKGPPKRDAKDKSPPVKDVCEYMAAHGDSQLTRGFPAKFTQYLQVEHGVTAKVAKALWNSRRRGEYYIVDDYELEEFVAWRRTHKLETKKVASKNWRKKQRKKH